MLSVVEACLDETCPNLDICLESVLLGQSVHHGEGLAETPGTAQELHHDAQREVRGHHVCCAHLVQEAECIRQAIVPCTPVEEAVEHHFVRSKLAVLPHLLHNFQAFVNVARHAVSLDDGGPSYNVRFHRRLRLLHVLQELRRTMHRTAPSVSIENGVVGDGVALEVALLHLLIQIHHFVRLLADREALQDRGVDHCIQQILETAVFSNLLHKSPCIIHTMVHDKSLYHASESNRSRFDLAACHLPPQLPDTLEVMSLAIGFDHGPVGRSSKLRQTTLAGILPCPF
mmetsp:Transcript_55335/g.101393  ORF Transcript_55335/g.101393 Transcript_55335/m.101393 type:complete len:286 (-) Transcript_55335:1132-1989(-)